jgi:1-acyl-sn-glycerol-3-phosphate acyltransferase
MVRLAAAHGKGSWPARETDARGRGTLDMGEGRAERAAEAGGARTTDSKGRVADVRGRVPDFRERRAELRERVPELRERGAQLTTRSAEELRSRGADLRTKGTELRTRGGELARHYSKLDVSWARCGYARALREALLTFGLGPLTDFYLRRRTRGREVFGQLTQPVVFVANHSSHLDTPTILRAMPRKWRSRTAVAAAADYFYKQRWTAAGVALLFNTVPLGRNGGGLSDGATEHVDRLIGQRWNLLMFPEGTRSRDGRIGKVHSGAAVIAAHHGVEIVPIHVTGTHDAMPPGQNWPKRIPGRLLSRRHKVEVRFGRPIGPRDEQHRREVMDGVRAFWEGKGLDAERDVASAPEAHDVLLMHRALQEYEAREASEPTARFARGDAHVEKPSADRSTSPA